MSITKSKEMESVVLEVFEITLKTFLDLVTQLDAAKLIGKRYF